MHKNSTFTGVQWISCNLCGAQDTRLIFQIPVLPHHVGKFNRDLWDIVQCKRCGLIYTNPQPDKVALEEFYRFSEPDAQSFVEEWFVEHQDLNRKYWNQILRALLRFQHEGELLDIGCGSGGFLVEARGAGFQVAGQDIAPFFIDYCRYQQNLTVYAGELDDLDLADQSFDCVTAFDVIEHHPDPKKLVEEMHRLVKPQGLVVIGTHDIGNFFARLYGKKWRHMLPIGHLTFFDRKTLRRMLEGCGFVVLHVSGAHTIDRGRIAELRNSLTMFFRVIILRAILILVYRPLTTLFPFLTRWSIQIGNTTINHAKLIRRIGTQVIMNDNMVFIARPRGEAN